MRTQQNDIKKERILKCKSAMIALLLWSSTSAFAFTPPLQDVQAGKETSGSTTTVWYRVYDPVLDTLKEGSKSFSGYSVQLINRNGLVAWLARSGGDYKIGYAVYDPAREKWIEDNSNYWSWSDSDPYAGSMSQSYTVSQLKNNDGIICWLVRDVWYDSWVGYMKSWNVIYVSYDPTEGTFQRGSSWYHDFEDEFISDTYSSFQLKTQNGVAAWTATNTSNYGYGDIFRDYIVAYGIYDPSAKSWQEDRDRYSNNIGSLSVLNATVHYSVSGTAYTRGYDPSSVSWYVGATKPLAYFAASPSAGFFTLNVWFTDMSIGATSWSWDFGDGSYGSDRSLLHTFTNVGEFTATQTVTGQQGTDSKNNKITIVASPIERTIYVDDDAVGANNGSSWTDAYNYLQDAIFDASALRDIGIVEIHVAQGVYTPDKNSDMPVGTSNRNATFRLLSDVPIIGGYSGFDAPDPNARDIVAYETILSGDLSGNDIDVNNPQEIRNEPTRSENSYHVVTGNETNETAILDGFTITAGYASYSYGGGIYNKEGNPTLNNCIFSTNYAYYDGGGMYNTKGNPTLTNCAFNTNYANDDGGGICNYSDNSPIITNCIFIANHAYDDGGGMYNDSNSCPTVTNCTFSANYARDYGGGTYQTSNCFSNLTNCILYYNTPEQVYPISSNYTITYSNIQGSWSGKGNIDLDPLFVSTGYWADINDINIVVEPSEPNAVWIDGDYHLKSQAGSWDSVNQIWVVDDVTSPCIDAGDPNSLVGDELEPNESIINMGAYGGTSQASMSPSQADDIRDLDNDGLVNWDDVMLLANKWDSQNAPLKEDINLDGIVVNGGVKVSHLAEQKCTA